MKAIGGYFGLEKREGDYVWQKYIYAVNSARNALLLFLKSKDIKSVYVPYYTCGVIIDTLKSNEIGINFYQIDFNLEIINDGIPTEAVIIYNNYFGVKSDYIGKIAQQYKHLIIDNAQALYETENPNSLATIYSPRKFFGLPDGGLLQTKELIDLQNYKVDSSYKRCEHLLKRIDVSPELAYSKFMDNDKSLENEPIKKMSKLTKFLLSQVDYKKAQKIRVKNFTFLHQELREKNTLTLNLEKQTPLSYPLLIPNGHKLKKELIQNKVYCATYWPDVLERVEVASFEAFLVDNLVSLPIDQRYNINDMKTILSLIKKYGP